MYCNFHDPHNSICIAIQYCDFIAISWSKHIAHHMSAAEEQVERHEKTSVDQSWKCVPSLSKWKYILEWIKTQEKLFIILQNVKIYLKMHYLFSLGVLLWTGRDAFDAVSLCVTAVVGRKRGGPMCSVVRVHLFNKVNWTLNNKQQRNNQNSSVWCRHIKTGNNHPQNRIENRLPKYGSQSGTTIDSCLWLRTIPGQSQKIIE